MSELTLILIRFAYLAILWIFVLSAISVIRSDMFGARVARGRARRGQPRAAGRARPRPPSRRSGAAARPPTCVVVEGANAGRARRRSTQAPILIGRGSDAAIRLDDDYVSTRHARIASLRRPVVRRGPRLHQRHLHRQRPDHPAHHAHARHPGPHRQDDPRAEEVADDRRHPSDAGDRRCGCAYAAISDVGRVRKDNQDSGYAGPHLLVVADGVGGAARGDIASSTAVQQLRRLDGPPTDGPARGRSPAPSTAPTTGSPSWSTRTPRSTAPAPPSPSALFDGTPARRRPRRRQPRLPLPRRRRCRQLTKDHTFVQSLIDEGRITEEESRVHPHRNLILEALDGVHETEPDLFHVELAPGDRLLLCSDGASGVLDDGRLADILGTGIARLRRGRAGPRQPRGRQLRQRHLRRRRRRRPARRRPIEAAASRSLVGAAAELPAPTPRRRGQPLPRPPRRRHRRARAGRRRDPRRRAVRDRQRPDRPRGGCATPRGRRAASRWLRRLLAVLVVLGARLDRPRPRPGRWSQHAVLRRRARTARSRSSAASRPTSPACREPSREHRRDRHDAADYDAEQVRDGIDAEPRRRPRDRRGSTAAELPDADAEPADADARPPRHADPHPSSPRDASDRPPTPTPSPTRRRRPTASRPRHERGPGPADCRLRAPPPPRRRAVPARARAWSSASAPTPRSASASRARSRPTSSGYGGWLAALVVVAATSWSGSSRRTPTRCCCRSWPRSTASAWR